MRAAESVSRDPRKKSSHDMKKLSRGSCKVRCRSWNSTREGDFSKEEKGLSEELKGQVIDKILETGGDRISGYFPVKWTELSDKFLFLERPLPFTVYWIKLM